MLLIGFDLMMAALMALIGWYFYRSQGKAANLLSGYNMRSPEERRHYDEPALCRLYGRQMMAMALPFLGGALLDFFRPGLGCMLAWGVWTVLFIRLILLRSQMEK